MATQTDVYTGAPIANLGQSQATPRTRRTPFKPSILWLYAMAIFLALIFMFPFFWTVMSSLKSPQEINTFPPTFTPEIPQWGNYPRVLEMQPFLRWFWNSTFVVLMTTTGTILTSSLVAYSFARFRYRGREFIFIVTLGTMMIPAQVTLIPQFVLFHRLGWINTLYPLWVPFWFGGTAFAIFLIRQFIMTLPRELDEAALIDGASYWQIFWRILIPLCKPVIATIGVITFIASWNDFVNPLIYLQLREKFTLAVGLNYFKSQPEMAGEPTEHLLMAASVMVIAPVIILFFTTQRYFVQGIALSGIKG
ncbi:MAG: carbohydrate ABC transporter permease [Chloroflexota bacterium]